MNKDQLNQGIALNTAIESIDSVLNPDDSINKMKVLDTLNTRLSIRDPQTKGEQEINDIINDCISGIKTSLEEAKTKLEEQLNKL